MFYTEELRKEFGDKYNFLQVYSVVFSKSENLTTITFLFDEKAKEITDEQREELQNFFAKKLELFSSLKLKFRKSFLEERDPAGVPLNNSLESLIGVDNPLLAFSNSLCQNLKTFSKQLDLFDDFLARSLRHTVIISYQTCNTIHYI